MLATGILLVFFGATLLVVSRKFFWAGMKNVWGGRKLGAVPLRIGEPGTIPSVRVPEGKPCKVAVAMDVRSPSVNEETRFNEREYKIRYDFPFSYRVVSSTGTEVASEMVSARWEGSPSRLMQGEKADASGGTAWVEHGFKTFSVSAPGLLRIEASLGADATYGAEAENVVASIYEEGSGGGKSCSAGCLLLLVGPVIILTGLILAIVGLVR